MSSGDLIDKVPAMSRAERLLHAEKALLEVERMCQRQSNSVPAERAHVLLELSACWMELAQAVAGSEEVPG